MRVAIIGLTQSGKSTVFNVLTGAHFEIKNYPTAEHHLGVVKIPDPRLEQLAGIFGSKKISHAEINFMDPGVSHKEHEKKVVEFSHAKEADCLVHVVRLFEDPNIIHPQGSIDAERDIALVELELIMQDLEVLGHRIEKIKKDLDRGKKEEEKEYQLLLKCKEKLEYETPLRDMEFSPEETKLLKGFLFLSQKPMIVVANISEENIGQKMPNHLQKLTEEKKVGFIEFCAKVEMEIEELSEQERGEFFKAEGITEPAPERFIKEIHKALDLITFYTGNEKETKAWLVKKGTQALEAAGKIHSDIERGFIKAEVINYKDLMDCGTTKVAREKGLLRLEGKEYVIADGDAILFRFSV
jgi:GTP-binding protein YchF